MLLRAGIASTSCWVVLAAAFTLTACGDSSRPQIPSSAIKGCSRVLGPNEDIDTALSSAQPGTTVCLTSGSYPTLKLSGIDPGGFVTVRSANAREATIAGIEAQRVSNLRFEDLTIRGPVTVEQTAHNIKLSHNDIGDSPCGIYLYAQPRSAIAGIVIANNRIHDLNFTGPEGVCSGYGIEAVGGVNDVLVAGNTIAHVANDYVQLGGGSNWTVAHNLFLGPSLRYTHAAVHQDLWQVFGGGSNLRFLDNVARHTATQESLLIQLGTYHNVTIANNLFDHDSSGYSVQLFQIDGLDFSYNTFVGSHWGVIFRADDPSAGPGRGYVIEHNIFGATSSGNPDVIEWQSFGRYDYNVSQDGSASGRHSIRHWRGRWSRGINYQPLYLPYNAGYRPTSFAAKTTFNRR